MAHVLLHYSLGVACVTLPTLPALIQQCRTGRPVARWLGRRLVLAHVLGLFATIPGGLPAIGIPVSWCTGWWMNIFLFHSLLDRLKPGGALIAELSTVVLFGLQYALVLYALIVREFRVPRKLGRAG